MSKLNRIEELRVRENIQLSNDILLLKSLICSCCCCVFNDRVSKICITFWNYTKNIFDKSVLIAVHEWQQICTARFSSDRDNMNVHTCKEVSDDVWIN